LSVRLVFRKEQFEVQAGTRLKDAYQQLNLNPESCLAVRDGELITEDVILREGDTVQLVAVISGGQI
jgi:sulfur carrier protein